MQIRMTVRVLELLFRSVSSFKTVTALLLDPVSLAVVAQRIVMRYDQFASNKTAKFRSSLLLIPRRDICHFSFRRVIWTLYVCC